MHRKEVKDQGYSPIATDRCRADALLTLYGFDGAEDVQEVVARFKLNEEKKNGNTGQ